MTDDDLEDKMLVGITAAIVTIGFAVVGFVLIIAARLLWGLAG